MAAKKTSRQFFCPVDGFQQMISGKYKLRVLWHLKEGPMRYGELKKRLNSTEGVKPVTARVLSRELKTLTDLTLIERKDFGTKPPKVEYKLSKVGHTLVPVVTGMHDWGVAHLVRDEVLKKVRLASRAAKK